MSSLRSRLILWNTLILALGLILVGGTIAWLNLSRMSEGIDRDLMARARFAPGPPGLQGVPGQGPPFRGDQPQPPFQQRPGQAPNGGPNSPPPFNDPESDLIGSIRRPRIVGPEGHTPEGSMDSVPFDPAAIDRVRRGRPEFSDVVFRGEAVRVYTAHSPRFGPGWIIQVARELRDYRELARVQWITLFTLLPVALLLAVIGGRFLTGRAMRPIATMGMAAREIGSGDFERRLAVEGDDEFAELGRRFNEMAEKLGLSFAQQKAAFEELQKAYEHQRRFVADASHELRTPLTRLQLITSSALDQPDANHRDALAKADEAGRGMAKLVGQLLDLARSDAGELKPILAKVDLRALAADVIGSFPADGAPITLQAPDMPVYAEVDSSQMGRALGNLLENARRHTPSDGRIEVTVGNAGIVVEDTGTGIPVEHLDRVMERFYRADASRTGAGAGLGLSIVDEIVAAHGETFTLESEPGKGTRASIRLSGPREESADSK